MAVINQIGGISTGSLASIASGPLASLFGTTTAKFNYQYPSDLGNDPSRMHIVKFDVYNIVPRKFTNTTATTLAKGVTSLASTAATSANQSNVLTQVDSVLSNPPQQTPTSVSLYMPDTLAMNYDARYSDLSIKEAGLRKLEGIASVGESLGALLKEGPTSQILSQLNDSDLIALGIEGAGSKLNKEAPSTLLLKSIGRAINPQLQLIYHGLGFRRFTMEFVFTPKSQQESDQVSSIINTFVYAQAPTINASDNGMYFTPPSIFKIRFLMAQTGAFSGLTSMLQKAGNSLVGGLNLGSAAGNLLGLSGPTTSGILGNDSGSTTTETGNPNNRLYKTGDCVLENVSVDYAPNGWAAFTGGAPVQTRLTLSFMETSILDRTRMSAGKAW